MRFLLAAMTAVAATLFMPVVQSAELMMFEEPGCVWCQRWHAEIGPGYPSSEEGLIAPLARRDIRDGRPTGVQLERAVTSTPTFVLVEDGAEKGRITGYPGADFFYPLLGDLLKRLTPLAPVAPLPSQRAARLIGGSRTR